MANTPSDDIYTRLDADALDGQVRAVFVLACRKLHYEHDLSLRDIASVLGVSHEWVRRALLSQSG